MLCLTPPPADSRGQAWKQRGMCTHLTGTSSDKQKAKEPDSYQRRTADAGSLFLEARAPFFKIKSSITFKAGGRQDFTSRDFPPFIQRLQMDFFYSEIATNGKNNQTILFELYRHTYNHNAFWTAHRTSFTMLFFIKKMLAVSETACCLQIAIYIFLYVRIANAFFIVPCWIPWSFSIKSICCRQFASTSSIYLSISVNKTEPDYFWGYCSQIHVRDLQWQN